MVTFRKLSVHQVSVVVTDTVLPNIATVDDFTDVLRTTFIANYALAAGVPTDQVQILSVVPASVAIQAAVVFPAEAEEAVTVFKGRIKNANNDPILIGDEFGDVEVVITPNTFRKAIVHCNVCSSDNISIGDINDDIITQIDYNFET
eukprot:scaffold251674_cov17-Prasinocladus_malaysianus.AAC.1